jgi:hypothetical protein
MEPRKQAILTALDAFVRQRPGMEFGNYGDVAAYRSESRSITRDLHDYRELERAVSWRDSITADMILEAARSAFSGRLTIECKVHPCAPDGCTTNYLAKTSYCTGQYFPTEYRKAACAVLAAALWYWTREHAMPSAIQHENGDRTYPHVNGSKNEQSAGDWLRTHFRKEFGARIGNRWFN